ncbi:MAG: hypothetical protein GXY61_10245 [Lentisphaerae bacterium]|nr:hypothetical protein [Lentisphaerota bacterium]
MKTRRLFIVGIALVSVNARAFYSPEQGRWISRDPDSEQLVARTSSRSEPQNVYSYFSNNPSGGANPFQSLYYTTQRPSPTSFFSPPAESGWFTGAWYINQNTIICDGNGSLIIHEATSYQYGIQDCTRKHEQQHITDWKSRYGANLCKGRNCGDLPYYDFSRWLFWKDSYSVFLNKSECSAWKIGLKCRKEKLNKCCNEKDPSACKRYVEPFVEQAEAQVKKYCN